ncbi:MAG: peptidylprolyl isomerase [Planctomycetota bacterium]|jgi:peptidyl-prolyl cis-trans isomerase C
MRNWILSVSTSACLAIFALLCPGCGSEDPAESGADKPEPNAVGASAAEAVAVTVNGIDILESEVEALVRPTLDKWAGKTKSMTAEAIAGQTAQLRRLTLEKLMRIALLDAQVMQAKIVIADEEVRSRIEQMAAAQGMTVAAFVENMKRNGRTLEGIRREVRAGLARDKFLAAQWEGKINVTEDDAKKYYDENTEEFKVPEQVRASHILIWPESAGDAEAMAKAKTKAEELLAQIKDGADFAELARLHSDCQSASKGGDLEFFPRGKMTPPFEKVAFELEVGELSDVVETEYGFHIIKVTDHVGPGVVSFEQTREKIIEALTQAKQIEFVDEYLNKLRAEAEIVYPSNT